ncbi:unnamed protein product [Sympodiomycopsis kandeliae]
MTASSMAAPKDKLASFNTLWEQRRSSDADQIFLGFAKRPAQSSERDASLEFRTYTFGQVDRLIKAVAGQFHAILPARTRGEPQKTVGLILQSDIDFVITEFALIRLGHAVALLSPNNSAAAIADLVEKSGAVLLVHDQKSRALTAEAVDLLHQNRLNVMVSAGFPVSTLDIDSNETTDGSRAELTEEEQLESTAVCMHSSGSTGFPKIHNYAQYKLVQRQVSFFGRGTSLSTLPFGHAYGNYSLWLCFLEARPLYMVPPSIPLTTQNLIQAMRLSKMTLFHAVPYTLKLIAANTEATAELATAKAVFNGGSSCPKDVGDTLVAAGINLLDFYGATECGGFMMPARMKNPKVSWHTQAVAEAAKEFVFMEPVEGNLYEPVIKDGWSRKHASNRPDGSWAMGDLFTPDTNFPDGWIFVGRKDDTLVHVNGEKTNPVPMESKIRSSKFVDDVLVFGAGKQQTGALVILSQEAEEPGQDAMKLIWPAIEAANSEAPSHSRLLPELIRLLPSTFNFAKADKMSLIRPRAMAAHKDLIEEIYEKYEHGDGSTKVVLGDLLHAREVLRQIVSEAIGSQKISDTEDLFEFGIDSITSERILSAVRRTVQLGDRKLNQMFVFENPTIAGMASNLCSTESSVRGQEQAMLDLVKQYSARVKFQDHPGSQCHDWRAHGVLLTGATGSLGAHLLHQLSRNQFVEKIYCLCRAKDDIDARKRVDESLAARGLPSIGTFPSSIQVHCLAADLAQKDLGLDRGVYATLPQNITTILHCGWPVNFNMSLRSFHSSIEGALNLINLSVDACAGFMFCSSVATVARSRTFPIPEEINKDPSVALPMGYGQSKWVVENLCHEATRAKGVETTILRIGQIAFDTQQGIWNEKEAIPLMIKGIESVHALPDLSAQENDWIPVDKAAEMIIDLLHPEVQLHTMAGVYHIASSVTISWTTVYEGLRQAGLQFDLIPPHEWVAKLQELANDNQALNVKTNPLLKLLHHFARQYGQQPTATPTVPKMVLEQKQVFEPGVTDDLLGWYTQGLKKEWYHTKPLTQEDIVKMVNAWKKTGFLH